MADAAQIDADADAVADSYRLGMFMIRIAEPAGPIFRVAMVGYLWALWPRTPALGFFCASLVVFNVATYLCMRRGRGLLSRGTPGLVAEYVHNVVVLTAVAFFVPTGSFGRGGQMPLSTYIDGTIAMLWNYPSPPRRLRSRRIRSLRRIRVGVTYGQRLALAFFGSGIALLFVDAWLTDSPIENSGFVIGVATQVLSGAAAIGLGAVVWRFVQRVSAAQLLVNDRLHHQWSSWLHSNVLNTSSQVLLALEVGDTALARQSVRSFRATVDEERLQSMLRATDADVGDIVAQQVRLFEHSMVFVSVPSFTTPFRVNAMTAFAISDAIGNLLGNAQKHGRVGEDVARVVFSVHSSVRNVIVAVEDEGPGFPADCDPLAGNGGLRRLHRELAEYGGGIEIESTQRGTMVRAIVPITRYVWHGTDR